MWIFTSAGFVSAVEHRDDESLLMIRARDKESLKVMLQGVAEAGKAAEEDYGVDGMTIYSEGGSDYPWRVVMSKATFAIWTTHEIMNFLKYHNFKNALTAIRGEKWHRAAMNVWTDMLAVEDKPDGWKPYQHLSDHEVDMLIKEEFEKAGIELSEEEASVLTDLGESGEGAAVLEDDEWLHGDLVKVNKDRLMTTVTPGDIPKALTTGAESTEEDSAWDDVRAGKDVY